MIDKHYTLINNMFRIFILLSVIFIVAQFSYLLGWNSAMQEYPIPLIRTWDPQPPICIQIQQGTIILDIKYQQNMEKDHDKDIFYNI